MKQIRKLFDVAMGTLVVVAFAVLISALTLLVIVGTYSEIVKLLAEM